jgi:hypothetical protein
MSHVFPNMLDRFLTVYGHPKSDNPAAFIEEYAKALSGFSAVILEKAAARIMSSHEYPTWPALGECVRNCREVAWELNPPEKPAPQPAFEKKHVGSDRVKALLRDAMGQGLNGDNDFEAIVARCPRGGSVNVGAPWGEEVRDKDGNIVPIRKRAGRAA